MGFDSQNLEIPDFEDYVGPNRIFVGSHSLFDEGTPQGGGGTSRHPLVGVQGHPPWLNKPPDPPVQQHFQPLQKPLEAPPHHYEGPNTSMEVQQGTSHVSKEGPPYLHPRIDHLTPQDRETGQLVQQYFQPLQQPLEAPPHLHEGSNASMEVQQGTSHVSKEAPPYLPPHIVYLPPQNQDTVQLVQQQFQPLQPHLEAHPQHYEDHNASREVQHVTSEEAPPYLHTKIDCLSPQHRETVQIMGMEQQHEAQIRLNKDFNVQVEVPPDPTHLGYGAALYLHPKTDYGAPTGCVNQQQLIPPQKQIEAHQHHYEGSNTSLEVQRNPSHFGKGEPSYLHPTIGYVPPHVRDVLLSVELNPQQVPPGEGSNTSWEVHTSPPPLNNGAPPYWHPTNDSGAPQSCIFLQYFSFEQHQPPPVQQYSNPFWVTLQA